MFITLGNDRVRGYRERPSENGLLARIKFLSRRFFLARFIHVSLRRDTRRPFAHRNRNPFFRA